MSNERVFAIANETIKRDTKQVAREKNRIRAQQKLKPRSAPTPTPIIPLTEELFRKHTLYIGHLLREHHCEPTRRVAIRGKDKPNHRAKVRTGGVRISWIITGLEQYWRLAMPRHVQLTEDRRYIQSTFDHTRSPHCDLLAHMAGSRLGKFT